MSLGFSEFKNDDSGIQRKRQPQLRRTIKKMPMMDDFNEMPQSAESQSENFSTLEPTTVEQSQTINENREFRVNDLINKMTAVSANDSGNKLANFTPPPNPVLNVKKPNAEGKSASNELSPSELLPRNNMQPTERPSWKSGAASSYAYGANESGANKYSNYNKSYEPPSIPMGNKPYYAAMGISGGNGGNGVADTKLMERINYMIHLLEEQQNEKTNNITEEFILYTFLGVFVIFVVDSFARAGKYIR
jgi:hypothetical protein